MLCTKCSNPVNPVVAIDIDGTLGDYHGHFINFAERYLGRVGVSDESLAYDGSVSFKKWCCGQWGIDYTEWNQIKLAYRQGGMKRSMPPNPGATDLCRNIRKAGAELWLTTTRPFLRLDNIDPDTRFWLEQQEIKYDGLLYDEHKYHRLAELVDPRRVVAVLDDLPEMWNEAAAAFNWRVPILKRSRFNRAVFSDNAMESLFDVEIEIVKRIERWKDTN